MENKFNCSTCMNMEYDLLKDVFFDTREETDKYIMCTSNTMDDYFWNLAYLKNQLDNNDLLKLEKKFKSLNRLSTLYIGRDDKCYEENKDLLLNSGYKLVDTDVYMLLDDIKTKDTNINIKVVETESEYNDFMKVLSSAYNDSIENPDENVYSDAITDCYYKAVKNSINNDKTYHIIGYDNGTPVSVATLNIVDEIGGINNVGTMQGYWNKGYSKQILAFLINLFKEHGGKYLTLCTEYKSKNQSYYEKLGFKELYVMEQFVKEV